MAPLRIGTRGSTLARAQANLVAGLLRQLRPPLEVEVIAIGVSGDEGSGAALVPEDKSRWVDRIEDALLEGRIDVAVHSAKDVPGELAPGLALLGAPARADARDVLCGAQSISALAAGARVGTGSVRRTAQLRAERQDLQIVPLRGNVDTRLRRLHDGGYDAIVLANAGLLRLGRADEAGGAPLDPDAFVPAAGQGILALQGRAGDERAAAAVRAVNDAATECALTAERALVRALDATCQTPVGAHAQLDHEGEVLELSAFVGLPDGSAWARDRLRGPASAPEALGRQAAQRLLAAGAGELLQRAQEMSLERA